MSPRWPAQIFVALAEEGWSEGEAVDAVTERYLAHLDARIDTVVLGCTHFPLLTGAIARQLGRTRRVVDSAATTARAAAKRSWRACRDWRQTVRPGTVQLMATDSPERFARVGARFLGSSIAIRSRGSNRPLDTFHKAVTLGAHTTYKGWS